MDDNPFSDDALTKQLPRANFRITDPNPDPLTSHQYPATGETFGTGQKASPAPAADNPFSDTALSQKPASDPFSDAPAAKSMGFPALGVPPSPENSGTPQQVSGTVGYPDIEARFKNTGAAAGAEGEAQQTQPGAGLVKKGVDWFLSQPPDYLSNKLGQATQAVEGATEGLTKFLLSQPSGALGAPKSVEETAGKAAKDVGAYLFEGGNIGEVGGLPEMVGKLESDSGRASYRQPPSMTNKYYGQYAGFVRSYGEGPEGVNNYARQALANNPNMTVGDFYAEYVLGTGSPGRGAKFSDLETTRVPGAQGAARNFMRNAGYSPDTPLKDAIGGLTTRGAPADLRARGSVGADISNIPEPRQPNSQWYREQDDKLFQLRQSATADRMQFNQLIESMPDEFKTPEMQERFYKAMENPELASEFSPDEQAYYDKFIAPLKREERDLYEELKKTDLDVSDYDPTYAHRIVKGREPVFDALAGERGATANPISGYKSLTAPSLKARKFFALEGAGGRKLVTLDNGKLTEINDRIGTSLRPDVGIGDNSEKKIGDTIKINGQPYTLKNATTDEIEANTNLKYYKNATANTIDNLIRLRAAARAAFYFNDLKNSPEFAMIAKKWDAKNIPEGWISPHMPLLSGYKMDPLMAHTIDDFYGKPKSELHEAIARVNQFAVRSLFWSPVAHTANTGAFWATARGWDWVTPTGIKSTFIDTAKALESVIKQDATYQQWMREGASFIYGGLKNQDFYRQMMQRLGEDIKRDPSKWDPIARIMGYGPSDLVKLIYNKSSNFLWASSDVMMMQRIFELKRKGLNTHEAITEAEKYIPNYRVPPQVLGSRAVAQLLKDPVLTEFSRYHYGAMKSLAHIANDLARGDPKTKFDAMGKIFVTGALMYYVWPAISYGIQQLTGDKKLEFGPKGSTKIPSDLIELYNGDKTFVQVISGLVTMAPVLRTIGEMYTGTDWFTGEKILGPVDQQKGALHQIGKEADFAAKNLVQPYGMLDQAGRPNSSLGKEALKTGLGLRNKPKKYVPSKSDWRKAARKPKGLIEKGFDKL